jgi:hypothetical protein
MRRNLLQTTISLTVVGMALVGSTAVAQTTIEEQADRILREMGEYLANAEEFSFRAEIDFDEFADWGQEIQYGGTATIAVRRPDGLHVVYDGDDRQSRVVYDGETVVFHDLRTNLYATIEAPGEIDDAVDRMFDLYGYSVPVADLVYSDPYETLIGSADFGVVVGRHTVDGRSSYHLAFSGETLDWQIWIEDGPQPVPRQLVITYKEEPGAPQYRARFTQWDFQPRLSQHYFDFVPPAGADEMEFLPVQDLPAQEEVEP